MSQYPADCTTVTKFGHFEDLPLPSPWGSGKSCEEHEKYEYEPRFEAITDLLTIAHLIL